MFPAWEQRAGAAESAYCPRVAAVIDNSDRNSIGDQTRIAKILVGCAHQQKGINRARLDAIALNFVMHILEMHPDEDVARSNRQRAHALIHEALGLAHSDKDLVAHLRDEEESLP